MRYHVYVTDTLYRAADTRPTGREGECWTDDLDAARDFAGSEAAVLYRAEVDISGAVEADGYDHDTDTTPADDPAYRARMAAAGATWIRYDDETETGREMSCYRLVRDIEIAAEEMPAEDDDDCGYGYDY